MRARWLGIGLLVIAALVGVAFFWKRPAPVPESKPAIPAGSPLIDLNRVKSLELIKDAGRVKFEKDEQDRWLITEPEKDMPDPLYFGGMTDVLSQLTRQTMVGSPDRKLLPQYGLEPAYATLVFEFKEGSPKKVLRVGRPNPAMSALYAWYEDEPEVFLIQPKIRMFLSYSFGEFRYRRLIGIEDEGATDFKVVVSDPELRKVLGVPETRELARLTAASGPAWILLDPNGNKTDNGQVESILSWMQKNSVADKVISITPKEIKAWGFDPPQAYFEISYPGRVEKVLVGNPQNGLIPLLQPGRMRVLGYAGNRILNYLGSDFKTHQLLAGDDQMKLDRIELSYPDGKTFTLIKLNPNSWAIDGDPKKRFNALKITWLTEPFVMMEYQNYIRERPVAWGKYGLEPPRLKLKFFSGKDLMVEVWIGNWDSSAGENYIYIPARDLLSWYARDLMQGIPPGADAFLAGESKP